MTFLYPPIDLTQLFDIDLILRFNEILPLFSNKQTKGVCSMKERHPKKLYDLRDKNWWKKPRLRSAKVESYIRPDQKEQWVFLILPDNTKVCLGIYPVKTNRRQLLAKAIKRLRDLWDHVRNRRWPDDC